MTGAFTGIDRTAPHSARMWNYFVGGKDHYQVDRDAAAELLAVYPGFAVKARTCRYFMFRTVRLLTAEMGIRQFLDIGTGLPTANNTHEVAQRIAPASRVVYVDNDPLVLSHARSLLTSSPQGTTCFVDADVRDPDRILDEARRALDFETPIALLMLGVLGHVVDHDEVRSIVRRLTDALPPGSFLVHCDGTTTDDSYVRGLEDCNHHAGQPYFARSHEQVASYYEGLELVDPGVVPIHLWRPETGTIGVSVSVDESGGVGRKS